MNFNDDTFFSLGLEYQHAAERLGLIAPRSLSLITFREDSIYQMDSLVVQVLSLITAIHIGHWTFFNVESASSIGGNS